MAEGCCNRTLAALRESVPLPLDILRWVLLPMVLNDSMRMVGSTYCFPDWIIKVVKNDFVQLHNDSIRKLRMGLRNETPRYVGFGTWVESCQVYDCSRPVITRVVRCSTTGWETMNHEAKLIKVHPCGAIDTVPCKLLSTDAEGEPQVVLPDRFEVVAGVHQCLLE